MKIPLIVIILSTILRNSESKCTSSVAVTTCVNEVLKPDKPLKISNYKSFLDLSKNNLETIPSDAFKNLPEITILHLSFNKIRSVDEESFAGLTKLKHLSLYDNQLTYIGNIVAHNPGLEVLSLGMNRIADISKDAFKNLLKLKELDLSFNELTVVPHGINVLSNLEFLDLRNNKIGDLPIKVFSKLNKLKELKLSDNKLTEIDASDFSGLVKLERLDVGFNSISKMNVDEMLEDMPSLKYFKVGLNSFTCSSLDHIVRALKRKRIEVPRGYTKNRDNVDGMYCTK